MAAASVGAGTPLGYIQFGDSVATDFKMFALDGVQGALSEGSTLVLKGTGEDDLVLCTDSETYSVAMVETSNTVLLLRPPSAAEAAAFCAGTGREARELSLVAEGMLAGQHEMKRVVAGVQRVREILREDEWRGGSGSGSGSGSGGGLVGSVAAAAAAASAAAAAAHARSAAGGQPQGGEQQQEEEEDGFAGDEAGEAALREMEEQEAAAAAPPPPPPQQQQQQQQQYQQQQLPIPALTVGSDEGGGGGGGASASAHTQALALETEERAAERAAALAALPFRPGRYDVGACARGLAAPRARRGWSLPELSQVVLASAGEIAAELARLGAAELEGGRYVLLSEAYRERVLGDICRAARGEGWRADALPLPALCGALEQHHPGVVRAVAVGHAVGGVSTGAGEGETCALCPLRVGLRVADRLLHSLRETAEARGGGGGGARGGHCALGVFLDKWHGLVEALWPSYPPPPRSAWPLEAARTLLLVEAGGAGGLDAVAYFPEAELPAEPGARFRALFAQRSAWREAELLPYVEPLAQPPHRKLMDLVATYCRVTNNADKSRTFSKK